MKKEISLHNKSIIVIFAMTMIITVVFITFGKYSQELGGNSVATIAKPQTVMLGGDLSTTLDKGEVGEYKFSITNKNGGNISEVSMNYKISIETDSAYTGNIKYSLFHCNESGVYDESTNAVYTNKNKSEVTTGQTDSEMKLSAGSEATHYYVLKYYVEEAGDIGIKVSITAEQAD